MGKFRNKFDNKVNKLVRKLNAKIQNDAYWRGRFYVHEVKKQYFSVGRNTEIIFTMEFVDLKYNRRYYKTYTTTEAYRRDCWGKIHSGISIDMNWFMVYYCRVWNEAPKVFVDEYKDYTPDQRWTKRVNKVMRHIFNA